MQRPLAVALVDFLTGSGIDAELYEDYSGRAMYGKTTTGVVLDSQEDLMNAMLALINDPEIFADLKQRVGVDDVCRSLSRDSLGKGVILY